MACNSVTFSTTDRRRLAVETRTAEPSSSSTEASILILWARLSDAVSNGNFATALVDAVATYRCRWILWMRRTRSKYQRHLKLWRLFLKWSRRPRPC